MSGTTTGCAMGMLLPPNFCEPDRENTKIEAHGGKPDNLLEDSLREILDFKFSSIYCDVMVKKVLFN